MSEVKELIFPELEYFEDYNGNFQDYFQAVYSIFESNFIKKQTHFQGVRVSAQKFPLVDGIHRTFYHITHEGEEEQNREPDFRRMERIRFPKFCIENCPHDHLLIWKNQRGRDTRILIFNEWILRFVLCHPFRCYSARHFGLICATLGVERNPFRFVLCQ